MKISAINNYPNYRQNTKKSQNFNGLWGKTTLRTDIDNVLCVPKIHEIKYYYPFVDEKQEDIKKIIKDRQSAEIVNENGFDKYRVLDCKLGKKLPFNQQQFEDYRKIDREQYSLYLENLDEDEPNQIGLMHYLSKDKYTNELPVDAQSPAWNKDLDGIAPEPSLIDGIISTENRALNFKR